MIDLHLHTTASDGRLTPADLIRVARSSGLTVISITDHDTTAAYGDAEPAARSAGVDLVAGIEISAVTAGRDLHLLGYFIDPAAQPLNAFLERQRADRVRRIVEMADRLAALGYPIDPQAVLASAGPGRSVGRPQVASALVAAGHVRTRDEAFERFLEHGGPAHVPRRGASPEDVITLIHHAGGICSMAHPGVSQRDELLPALAAAGLDALEVRHSDHNDEIEHRYRRIARELGLLVTGGSDFHGGDGHRAPMLGVVTLPYEDYAALCSHRRDR